MAIDLRLHFEDIKMRNPSWIMNEDELEAVLKPSEIKKLSSFIEMAAQKLFAINQDDCYNIDQALYGF